MDLENPESDEDEGMVDGAEGGTPLREDAETVYKAHTGMGFTETIFYAFSLGPQLFIWMRASGGASRFLLNEHSILIDYISIFINYIEFCKYCSSILQIDEYLDRYTSNNCSKFGTIPWGLSWLRPNVNVMEHYKNYAYVE